MISEYQIPEAEEITAHYYNDEDGAVIDHLTIHGKQISEPLESHLLEHNGDRWCRMIDQYNKGADEQSRVDSIIYDKEVA